MTLRNYTKTFLIISIVVLSLGGLMLHIRIHPLQINTANIIPIICGLLSLSAVPALFSFKKTVQYGYVLNGMLAIIGTIIMTHYSIANLPKPFNLETILFETLFASILMLWTVFFTGKAIFELETFGYAEDKEKKGITYRYPNMGWWFVHLCALSVIYTLGHFLWRQS
jgi:hypothetical protein